MSNSVDQRIVEMQFDNSQFEKGINETLASLKALEKSMTLEDGSSGIEALNKHLSKISGVLDDVSSKFSVMGAVAFTAIQRASNAIIDLGTNIAREATIQPLIDGLDEYHLKMNSIKTIQTNTLGKSSLEDINGALSELNTYADKTIYNFAEMTRNIGTFTAAGVDLETATSSIQGIANLAAASGSNAGQASTAMYQLSQAISLGALKLQDWNSVVNAGMGGKFFQNALIETSRAMGTGVDEAIEKYGSFRESLKAGWADVNVLTQTLENFTYATEDMTEAEIKETTAKLKQIGYTDEQIKKIYEQANASQAAATKVRTFQQLIDTTKEALGSGWAVTWEYIIGDLGEAEEVFTKISNGLNSVIDGISDARNALFKEWHDAGGRDALFGAFFSLVNAFEKPIQIIRHGIEKVLEPISGAQLAERFKEFKKFVDDVAAAFNGNYLKDHNPFGLAFRTVRRIIEADLMVIITAVKSAIAIIVPIVSGTVAGLVEIITHGILLIRRVLRVIVDFGDKILGPALEALFSPIAYFLESVGLSDVVKFFSNFAKSLSGFFRVIQHQSKPLNSFADGLNGIVEAVSGMASKIGGAIYFVEHIIASLLEGITLALKSNGTNIINALASFGESVIAPIVQGLGSLFSDLLNSLLGFVSGLSSAGSVPSILTDLANGFQHLFDSVSSGNISEVFDEVKNFASQSVGQGIQIVSDKIRDLGKAFSDFASGPGAKILETIAGGFQKLGEMLGLVKDKVVSAWEGLVGIFQNAGFDWKPFEDFFGNLGSIFTDFFESIGSDGFDISKLFKLFDDLRNNAGDLFGKLAPSFEKVTSDIKDAIYNNLEGPLKDLWTWITNIANPLESLSTNLGNNADKLSNLFGGVNLPWSSDASSFGSDPGGIGASLETSSEQIMDKGFNFIDALTNLSKAIKDPIGTLKTSFGNAFKTIGKDINEFAKGIDWNMLRDVTGHIVSLGASGGMIYSLFEMGRLMESGAGLLESLKGGIDAIKGIATKLQNVADAVKNNIRTKSLKNIAISIAILVGSLIALSFSDLDKVKSALPIVVGLLVEVSIIVAIFGRLAGADGFNMAGVASFANAMLMIAVAVGIMGIVTAKLGNMDPGQLKQGEKVLIEFAILMGILTFIMTKMPKGVSSLGSTFMGLAGAFAVLAIVIGILGVIPSDVLQQGGAALVALAAGIAVISAIIGAVGPNLEKGAKGLLQMAGVVVILVAAMAVLGNMKPEALVQGGAAMAIMLLTLMGVVAVITKYKPSAMLKGANSLIVMAGALMMISISLAGLAMIGAMGGDLIGAAVALLILSGGLALIAAVLGKFGNLDQSANGLAKLAIVLAVLTASLIALSLVGVDKIWPAMGALAVELIILCGAFALINVVGSALPKTASSIGAFVVMIAAVIAAMYMLQVIDAKSVSDNLLNLVAVVAIFVVGMFALGAVGLVVGDGLILLAAAFAIFAVSAAIFIGSLAALLSTVPGFVDALGRMKDVAPEAVDGIIQAIQRLGQGLWDSKDQIAMGIMGLGYGLLTGILGLIPMAVMAIGVFIGELLGAIIMLAPAIGEGAILIVSGFITGISTGLREHGGEILNAIGSLFTTIIEGIGGIFSEGVNQFNNWLYDITGGLMGAEPQVHDAAKGVTEAGSQGAQEGNTMSEDMEAKKNEMLEKLKASNPEMYEVAKNFTGMSSEGAKDGAEGFDIMKTLGLDSSAMNMNLADVAAKAKEMGIALPTNLTQAAESSLGESLTLGEIMNESGYLDPTMLNEHLHSIGLDAVGGDPGFYGGAEEASATMDITPMLSGEGALDQEAIRSDFHEAGTTAATSFVDSFSDNLKVDGTGPVRQAAQRMQMASTFKNSGKINGTAAVKGMSEGMKTMSSKVKTATDSAKKTVDDSKSGMKSSGHDVGKNLAEGMASGINNNLDSVRSAVERMEELADRALRAKAKISSPSKVFAEIGAFMVEGLVVGIESMHGDLKSSVEDTGDVAISAMATQAGYLSGLLDDIEENPVIRPVLDLTDYNATLATMKGFDTGSMMLSAQAAGLSRNFGTGSKTAPTTKNDISIYLNYDASADANQIVMDIANGLETRLALEGA